MNLTRFAKSDKALHRSRLILFAASACSLLAAQAPPQLPSTDGDGMPDIYKTSPVEIHVPGRPTVSLDLSKQCVNDSNGRPTCVHKGQKTVVVLVDWMASGPDHNHKPVASKENRAIFGKSILVDYAPLSRVQQAFLDRGVLLAIVFADQLFSWFQPIAEQTSLGKLKPNKEYDWTDFDAIRKERTGDYERLFGQGFHYAAFIHKFADQENSGLSKTIPGDEFLVSLGAFNDGLVNADEHSGTFMHELGHNLGLRHGGFEDTNYKPNYLSIMNYMFQMSGTGTNRTFGQYQYSSVKLKPITEANVDPGSTLSDDSGSVFSTAFACFDASVQPCNRRTPKQPKRFDVIGSVGQRPDGWECKPATPAQWDVNGDGCFDTLESYNDWAHILYRGSAEPAQATTSGGVPRSVPLPGDEMPAGWPTIESRITPDSVRVTETPQGTVMISWLGIPLQDVIGYQVIRYGPSGPSMVWQSHARSFEDKNVKPGLTYTYSVVPVFYGTEQKFSDLLANVPYALLEGANFLESRARRVLPSLEGGVLIRGHAASAAPITVK